MNDFSGLVGRGIVFFCIVAIGAPGGGGGGANGAMLDGGLPGGGGGGGGGGLMEGIGPGVTKTADVTGGPPGTLDI